MKEAIIDASNLIIGRLASHVAKRLLLGESITIVNAEKAIISGKRKSVVRETKDFLRVGGTRWSPKHPRRPDTMLRRTIRGMLPRNKHRGKMAYRRLKVFVGIPKKFEGKPMETVKGAHMGKLKGPYVELGDLARELGWQRR
jgi:large subunit ribosomal protein L13